MAETLDDLHEKYQMAVTDYETALTEQTRNDHEIIRTETQIVTVRVELKKAELLSDEAAVALYKSSSSRSQLIDMLLDSNSLSDAIELYEGYKRIEDHYLETIEKARAKQAELDALAKQLAARKSALKEKVSTAKQTVEDVERAIRNADHSDGAEYHQLQGNGSNCGATSFIVGVNILLHENKFSDNVAVWNGPGFNGNSTAAVGYKGTKWLEANDLGNTIACEDVVGDIKTTDQLREELRQGRIIVISSGPGSLWQRADGTTAEKGTFPDGHFIVFYHYENGVFYANDSSVSAEKGAGVRYTEEQMEQWMNGRSTHFAVRMYVK